MAPTSLHPGKQPWWIEVIFWISENPLTWICFLWSCSPIGVLTSLHPWLYPKFHPFRKNLQILVDLAPLGCTKPGVVSVNGAGPGVWPPGMIATGTCRDAHLNRWIWQKCLRYELNWLFLQLPSYHSQLISSEIRNPTHSKEGVAKWDHYLSWIWTRQSRRCKHCQFDCSIISTNKNISWYEYTYFNYDFTTAHHTYQLSCLLYCVSVTQLHKIYTPWNAGAWPFDLAKFCSSTKALCDAANSACDLAQYRWNPREMCWKKLNVTLVSWNFYWNSEKRFTSTSSVSFFSFRVVTETENQTTPPTYHGITKSKMKHTSSWFPTNSLKLTPWHPNQGVWKMTFPSLYGIFSLSNEALKPKVCQGLGVFKSKGSLLKISRSHSLKTTWPRRTFG